MEETVTSVFSNVFYQRAVVMGGVLLWLTSQVVPPLFSSRYQHPVGLFIFAAFFCAVDWLFLRAFLRSYKRITVAPEAILVKNITGKQTRIPYAEITGINTYRSSGKTGRFGGRFSADFVLEYGNDKWLSINESSFENYKQLTMAIYLYKYGPGHGRERYLERHGGG